MSTHSEQLTILMPIDILHFVILYVVVHYYLFSVLSERKSNFFEKEKYVNLNQLLILLL